MFVPDLIVLANDKMDFAELNALAAASYLPLKKISDLESGKVYPIVLFREANTMFGKRVMVDVNPVPGNHDEDFSMFLPKKLALFLLNNMEKYNELQEDALGGRIVMDCNGSKQKTIAFRKV